MTRRPLSDEFDLDGLDGQDYADSFGGNEPFGPLAATSARQLERELAGFPTSKWAALNAGAELERSDEEQYRDQVLRAAGYVCAVCRVNLSQHRHLLQAHRPGTVKQVRGPQDLMCVCLDCHADMWNHSFMRSRYSPAAFAEIRRLRKEQGLRDPAPRRALW